MADARPRLGGDTLRHRLEGELGRRLVHASGALLPLSYLLFERVEAVPVTWRWLQAVLLVAVGVAAVLEYARLHAGLDWWVYEHLTRPYEAEKVAGYALYVVSFAVVALAFEPAIALSAMFMLAIADPIGGVLSGDDPIPVKRPLALAGTFLVCLAIGLVLLPSPVAAVAAAAAATAADGVFLQVRGYVIDDNLSLPLSAAVVAWLVVTISPV